MIENRAQHITDTKDAMTHSVFWGTDLLCLCMKNIKAHNSQNQAMMKLEAFLIKIHCHHKGTKCCGANK
jgi:hypothetical protein